MIILIRLEGETIFRETQNSDVEFVTNAIFAEFPRSSFFIIDNEYLKVYQYVKGSLKFKTEFNCGLFMIFDKYPEFVTDELITLCYEFPFDYEDYLAHIDDIKEGVSKPIVIDKWKYKIGIFDFDNIINKMDPTRNQKYLNWCLHINYTTSIMDEDYDKTSDMLKDFDNPQVKALIKKAGYSIDIMSYETINDLFKVLNECYYSKLDAIESGDREILYQKRKIFEDNDWLVVIPETHEESITLGRGTNWCTAADSEQGANHFDTYTNFKDEFYPLYIFINKHDNVKKYQWTKLHTNFLDWNDEEFKINKVFLPSFIADFYEVVDDIPFEFHQVLSKNKNKYLKSWVITRTSDEKAVFIKNKEYIDILLNDNNNQVKGMLITAGYNTEEAIVSEHWHDRYCAAKGGYGVETLVYDKSSQVREGVAIFGYGLYILAYDEDKHLRLNIARMGKALDILVYDEDWQIKTAVMNHGYGLDILMNDNDPTVRKNVAYHGYGLDILINDDDETVRYIAGTTQDKINSGQLKLEINNYGFEWYK